MKLLRTICFCLTAFATSCGYHAVSGEPIAISVPYVIGDYDGELTDALIFAVARAPNFRYAHGKGDWILKAKIQKVSDERIGFKYDRDDKSGKLRDNLLGIENRRTVSVEIQVIEAESGDLVLGPQVLKIDKDYDYSDPSSLRDLSFIDLSGTRVTSVAFSLGQLDTVGAAGEDALKPVFQKVAQVVVEGMIASLVYGNE